MMGVTSVPGGAMLNRRTLDILVPMIYVLLIMIAVFNIPASGREETPLHLP